MLRRLCSILINASIVIVSLLAVVVVVDLVAYYVFDIKHKGYRPERFIEFSPRYGHVHRAGAEGKWYRYLTGKTFTVKTNRHGFPDDERSIEKTRPRIALIGDSTAEFWEVEEPDRGQYVLEEKLGGEWEVINLAVRGYGTDQTYLLFRDVGVEYDPDIVVYMFCINDIAENVKRRGKPYFELAPEHDGELVLANQPVSGPPPGEEFSFLERRSFVFRLLEEFRNAARIGTRIRNLTGSDAPKPRPHFELRAYKREYDEEDRRRMEITTRLISKLSDFVTAHGMKFLVVEGVYRPADDPRMRRDVVEIYGDIFDFDRVTETLSDHCRREGIPFLSLASEAEARGVEPSSLMHRLDNMHLDARGVRFFADVAADEMRARGWLERP